MHTKVESVKLQKKATTIRLNQSNALHAPQAIKDAPSRTATRRQTILGKSFHGNADRLLKIQLITTPLMIIIIIT